jgi:hypothetical protein
MAAYIPKAVCIAGSGKVPERYIVAANRVDERRILKQSKKFNLKLSGRK